MYAIILYIKNRQFETIVFSSWNNNFKQLSSQEKIYIIEYYIIGFRLFFNQPTARHYLQILLEKDLNINNLEKIYLGTCVRPINPKSCKRLDQELSLQAKLLKSSIQMIKCHFYLPGSYTKTVIQWTRTKYLYIIFKYRHVDDTWFLKSYAAESKPLVTRYDRRHSLKKRKYTEITGQRVHR